MWLKDRFRKRRVEGMLLLIGAIYGIAWGIGRLVTAPLGLESAVLSLVIGLLMLLGGVGTLFTVWIRNRYRRLRAIRLSDVDYMEGLAFEEYVCKLMERQGYRAQNVKGSGDFGVDVVAERAGVRYAVQVKRYKGKVSRRAISDAVAGKYHFNCDAAMVVTNSTFTTSAKKLARSTGCELVDRDVLADWILDFQQGSGHRRSTHLTLLNWIEPRVKKSNE